MTRLIDDTFGVAAAVSYFKRDFGSDNIESNGDDEAEQRHYSITRERLGTAINLDYRPNFNDEFFMRTLYSKFSDDEFRQANIFKLDGDDSEIERESKDRKETQTIFTLATGGEHQRGLWSLDYQLGYAKSDETDPDGLYYVFVSENPSVEANLDTEIPQISLNAMANYLANYDLDQISFAKTLA